MAVLRPPGGISSSLLQSASSSSEAPDGQEGVPLESDAGTEPESVEGGESTSAFEVLDDLKPECPDQCELTHCSQPPRVQPGVVQHAAIDAFSRIGKLTSIQMPWESPSASAIFSDLPAVLQPSLAACWMGNVHNVQTVQPQIETCKPAVDVNFDAAAQGPVFAKVVKSRQSITPQQKRQRDWSKAVNI